MATVAIALGSNIDPEDNLPRGLEALAGHPGLDLSHASKTYASPAEGPPGQPDFHNAVALVTTDLGPLELRAELRAIEAGLGRRRTDDKYAARPLDLDIVFYDSVVLRTAGVTIPDPEALTMPHIVVPLADVAPDWRPPGGELTATEAAANHALAIVEPGGD